MSELEIIAEYGDLCGEGPVWDPDCRALYWVDAGSAKLYRYDWDSRTHALILQRRVHSYRPNRAGGFVLAGPDGFWLWDGAEGFRLIADEVAGSKCRINDSVSDAAGRFIGASNFYSPEGEYERGKIISVDTAGKPTVLDEGFELSNGMGFSPDNRTFYYTDSVARRIYAYDYDLSTGAASNRRVFVQVPSTEGVPDGLAVDAEGFVWSAQWYGSTVVRYDPDGKVERKIATPAKQTSSLVFGGPDLTDIFITSAGFSEAMPCMPPGYDAVNGYFGGQLYRVNVGIRGLAQPKAAIAL
jgi:sugar lactone lactonase YvrE